MNKTLVFVLATVWASPAFAQHHESMPEHKEQTNALVQAVREATARFRDVSVAQGEGYVLQFGCVSGSSEGAMGVHFVKGALVGDPAIDATHPEALVYEPMSDGRMRLVAAEYLVLADMWNAKHASPPELMGQLFHLTDSPNRFGLPAFYALHVWAWRENSQGTFANWNPHVSCDGYNPPGQ